MSGVIVAIASRIDRSLRPAGSRSKASHPRASRARACHGDPARSPARPRVAPPVVADRQHDAVLLRTQLEPHARRFGMTRDVRQRLLRHAIDDQLFLRRYLDRLAPGPSRPAPSLGVRTRPPARPARSRAPAPRARPDAAGVRSCAPPRPRASPSRAAPRAEPRSSSGISSRQAFDLQDHPRQRLTDLVVQLARDPLALSLLGQQRPARTLSPLVLQPVEHLVERRARARPRWRHRSAGPARRAPRGPAVASCRRVRRAARTPVATAPDWRAAGRAALRPG